MCYKKLKATLFIKKIEKLDLKKKKLKQIVKRKKHFQLFLNAHTCTKPPILICYFKSFEKLVNNFISLNLIIVLE